MQLYRDRMQPVLGDSCRVCGQSVPGRARFCSLCGARAPDPPVGRFVAVHDSGVPPPRVVSADADHRAGFGTFLARLADGDRDALLSCGGIRRFARGEYLMRAGERGDRVLVLTRGHVKASSGDSRGREVVLAFRGAGDVLGETTFVTAEPRFSDVVAIEEVEAQGLSAAEFRTYLLRRPTAAIVLIDVIGARFHDANRERLQFAALDTVGRVAARLIELCERYGTRTDAGTEIRLAVTQADLGGWTASSPAAVARALQMMRDLGWITTERRRITVLDLEALGRRAA